MALSVSSKTVTLGVHNSSNERLWHSGDGLSTLPWLSRSLLETKRLHDDAICASRSVFGTKKGSFDTPVKTATGQRVPYHGIRTVLYR